MSYEIRPHTADVAIEVHVATLDKLFGALGDGLAACMLDSDPPPDGERFELHVEAESLEAAAFDYLDELIYERDVRNVLPVDNEARVHQMNEHFRIEASARGVPLEQITAREVKAVTYADMVIESTADGWRGYVVFDV